MSGHLISSFGLANRFSFNIFRLNGVGDSASLWRLDELEKLSWHAHCLIRKLSNLEVYHLLLGRHRLYWLQDVDFALEQADHASHVIAFS